MGAWAEPRNHSDIEHVDGCIGTAGCRCAHYAQLNPPDRLPAELRSRVEAIDRFYATPRVAQEPVPCPFKIGDVVQATITRGLLTKGARYRVNRVHEDGRIGFVGLEPLLGSPENYELVPPTPDPGLPEGYSAEALPPQWTCLQLSGASGGIGYKHAGRGRIIYRQSGRSWVLSGSRYLAPAEATLHEAMRDALGLNWIGELWSDPEALGRP